MDALRPGGRVLLHSLAMEELNGAVGHLQTFHEERGRWAVKVGPSAPKLLKPANLKAIDAIDVAVPSIPSITAEILGEDIFLRICHFLPAGSVTATSNCSCNVHKQLKESVSLWQSLCYSLLDDAVITLHLAASDSGVHADQSAEFWRTLFRAGYKPIAFYYEHSLRKRCLHSSECFQQSIIQSNGYSATSESPGISERLEHLDSAVYFEKRQKILGASGHTASALKDFVVVIGGWRPWSLGTDLHVAVLDLLNMKLSEPPLASESYQPMRRLRHSSCTVRRGGSPCILVLGGCNDKSHDPCDGLQTLLFLELLQGGKPGKPDCHTVGHGDGSDTSLEINWRKVSATGPVPQAIWHHAADSFAGGQKVVVFGGDIPARDPEFTFIGDRAYANYVYILDIDSQQWERVQTQGQIPHWRSLHFGATFSSNTTAEHFVIMGGCDEHLEIFQGGRPAVMVGYSLNLKTLSWKRGAERRKGKPLFVPAPRMRFGAQRYGRHLLVYGGHGTEAIPEEEELLVLNTTNLEWQFAQIANQASEFGVAPAAALAGGCVLGGVELGLRGAHPVCYASLGSGLLRFDFSLLEMLLAKGVPVTSVHLVDSQYEPDAQGYMRHKVALAQFASWFASRGVEVYGHYSLERYAFEARRTSALPAAVLQVDCFELTAVFDQEVKPALEEVLQLGGLYCALTSREGASGAGSMGSTCAWAEATSFQGFSIFCVG
eukprot:symbB.v1.2.011623.t1/scaffold740.1/size166498/3